MTELKPCPFCGSKDLEIVIVRGFEVVECHDCLIRTYQIEGDGPEQYWNRRVKE